MKILIYNYNRMHSKIWNELKRELYYMAHLQKVEVWNYVKKFEKDFAKDYNYPYGIGTHSGTAALELGLKGFNIGNGDEVITTANTYIGVALAISNSGAKPVFVDVNEDTYNIDVEKIEDAITEKTKAIIPVHLYGQMADMKPIQKIAKNHGLKIIEDAAQAHGAKYLGKKAGYFSDMVFFSFHTTKNLGGCGNGGIILCKKLSLMKKLRAFRDPSKNDGRLLLSHRTPIFLDESQIPFIKVKQRYLDNWIKIKRKTASEYDKKIKNKNILLPKEDIKYYHSYHDYITRVKKRFFLKNYLCLKHIETAIHYPIPLHLTRPFSYLKYKKGDFPITEKISKEILSIPINPFLIKKEKLHIIRCLNKFNF